MERLTEYHAGVAVIKDKAQQKKAMAKLAAYENTGLTPREITDGKMLTGWIAVEERLPEENARILATIKHHKWTSDYDSDWVPESEKIVHPEYTEVCEAIYFRDIGWEYMDMTGETAFSEDYAFVNPNRNIAEPIVEVLAWMPMLEPYRPETELAEMEGTDEN